MCLHFNVLSYLPTEDGLSTIRRVLWQQNFFLVSSRLSSNIVNISSNTLFLIHNLMVFFLLVAVNVVPVSNVALNKAASMSSQYDSIAVASNAVDGKLN